MNQYDNFIYELILMFLYNIIHCNYYLFYIISKVLINCLFILLRKYYNLLLIKYIYIPINLDVNLVKVIIIYKNIIIFANQINLNYYHIKFKHKNKNRYIIGNDKYVSINYKFDKFINLPQKKVSKKINIIFLPIYKYSIEDCCICYTNMGELVGVCGHQNVCRECLKKINKCPLCNTTITYNKLNLLINN